MSKHGCHTGIGHLKTHPPFSLSPSASHSFSLFLRPSLAPLSLLSLPPSLSTLSASLPTLPLPLFSWPHSPRRHPRLRSFSELFKAWPFAGVFGGYGARLEATVMSWNRYEWSPESPRGVCFHGGAPGVCGRRWGTGDFAPQGGAPEI